MTESDGALPVDSSSTEVLSALGELNNTVNKLVQRMEKQEMRLESMEEKLDSTSLSSSASESRAKVTRKVPVVVRVSASVVHSNGLKTCRLAIVPALQFITFNCVILLLRILYRCCLYLLQNIVPGAITSTERSLRYKKEAEEET